MAKLSDIIGGSRYSTGNSGKLSDAANNTNNTAFSDFIHTIPGITVGLGTSFTSGINVSPSASLDEGATYRIYIAGLASVGTSMFRETFIRNFNNVSLSVTNATDVTQFDIPAFIGGDLRIGRFTTTSNGPTVSVTYDDGVNNTRSSNNSWSIQSVNVSNQPTSASFTWEDFSYSGDQTITIANNGSQSVTVSFDIIGTHASQFSIALGDSTATISPSGSVNRDISFSSGSDGTYQATFRTRVEGSTEASTSLSGSRTSGGGGGL